MNSASTTASPGPEPPRRPRLAVATRRLLAAGLVFLALVIAGYAAYRFFRSNPIAERIAVTPIDDPKELAARRRDAVGTFATGATPGDRVITVTADGNIEFSEIGADPRTSRTADSWQLARRDRKFCLTTNASGIVDIINIDTIAYYGDTYRRTK